eukprot:11556888-Karenia_brevis.AAC.1
MPSEQEGTSHDHPATTGPEAEATEEAEDDTDTKSGQAKPVTTECHMAADTSLPGKPSNTGGGSLPQGAGRGGHHP